MKPLILLAFSEVSRRGGIQVFGEHFIEATCRVLKDARITVLLLNNSTAPVWAQTATGVHFICCGSRMRWKAKLMFVAMSFWWVLQRPTCMVFGHVNLSRWGPLLRRILGVPYAVVTYGIDVWSLKELTKRKSLQQSTLVAAISRFTSSKLREQLGLAEIMLFPPTVDGSRFPQGPKPVSLVDKYGLYGCKVILTVARLDSTERDKGYDRVIAVLPQIRNKIKNLKYLLVGSGDDLSRVLQMIETLGLKETVVLPGFVANEELADYYNACDVFVMPSKKEGFGIVFLEALACGKPVVAGNQDGSRDALLDGRLGFLVDPEREDQLVNTITQVLEGTADPLLLNPVYLRRTVLEHFGFEAFCKRVEELFSRLCVD